MAGAFGGDSKLCEIECCEANIISATGTETVSFESAGVESARTIKPEAHKR